MERYRARAADFLFFTAKGSDEGHRAVIEAMGCAAVPIVAPLPGMEAIVGHLPLIAKDGDLASHLLSAVQKLDDLRDAVVRQAGQFAYPRAAQRLISVYSRVL